MRDYTPKIVKQNLVHGEYYKGTCRNATIARWNANFGRFTYRRHKFGHTFLEEIFCPEDDIRYDVFVTERIATPEEIEKAGGEIPI